MPPYSYDRRTAALDWKDVQFEIADLASSLPSEPLAQEAKVFVTPGTPTKRNVTEAINRLEKLLRRPQHATGFDRGFGGTERRLTVRRVELLKDFLKTMDKQAGSRTSHGSSISSGTSSMSGAPGRQ